METNCWRWFKYSLNHCSSKPWIPTFSSFFSKIEILHASNAFCKSQKITRRCFLEFRALAAAFRRWVIGWIVECEFRKPNCLSESALLLSRNFTNLRWTIFSRIFEKLLRSEIGLKLFISRGSPTLKIGTTFAILNFFGRVPVSTERLKMWISGFFYIWSDFFY